MRIISQGKIDEILSNKPEERRGINMINKKNLWFLTLFSLVLVLSIYYVTMPNEIFDKNIKETTTDNSTTKVEETENVVKHALDLGINFFDTANGYSAGTSEEYLGCALKKNVQRKNVVIASKVYFNPGSLYHSPF